MSALASPRTVEEAVAALAAAPGAVLVAGGTDVVAHARAHGRPLDAPLVSLHEVAALRRVSAEDGGRLRIGAGATHAALAADPRVRAAAPALADAAAIIGGPPTRSVATLGGNVANGSPAMDAGAPLLVHDAIAEIAGPDGVRRAPVADLLLAPGRVALAPGELLVAFVLRGGAGAYLRHGVREAMEVALVGAAARLVLDGGRIAEARVALTAVAPTCVRAPEAEALLTGAAPDDATLAAAGEAAARAAAPIDDHRAPADYRAAVVAVVARRALQAARARALGEATS